jgi:hypothetical protein
VVLKSASAIRTKANIAISLCVAGATWIGVQAKKIPQWTLTSIGAMFYSLGWSAATTVQFALWCRAAVIVGWKEGMKRGATSFPHPQ